MSEAIDPECKALALQLEQDLLGLYGSPILSGEQLRLAMGYRSVEALRQSIVRNTIPITVFTIQNRRGRYALTKDVALWLAQQRTDSSDT
ncbi:hypothetical protein [Pseudoalteromonas rubra]|uniref:hypothetical protein n=1 Tax=Pseudoalteromonas rubra TaxID=43658 RepID=UPI000AC5E739|nr:hypothetical protein [Pseudoalteromonas rubra]